MRMRTLRSTLAAGGGSAGSGLVTFLAIFLTILVSACVCRSGLRQKYPYSSRSYGLLCGASSSACIKLGENLGLE